MESLGDIAAKVLMIGLEGPTLTPEERDFLIKTCPAGVILFGRNISQDNHEALQDLTQDIQSIYSQRSKNLSALIAIDQEGGRVSRLKGKFPNRGPAFMLEGGSDSPEALGLIQEYGYIVGRALGNLGINVNFAPVVDLLTEPLNTAIGDRCFGTTPDQVILRAGAYLEGLTRAGVMGCLKHFPGQGHARVDTHLGTAVVDVDLPTLRDRELRPFVALKEKAPMVMVAHSVYPVIDDKEASRSKVMISDLLRQEIGYRGVVVSDDMLMGAIPQENEEWIGALHESIIAGVDLLLVCKGLDRARLAWSSLIEKAQNDESFYKILYQRAERVRQLLLFNK